MNREIIDIGGNHHNTLSILRSLGERGVKSLLIVLSDDFKPYVRYSKYVSDVKVVRTLDEVLSAMFSLHKSSDKAVVIACADSISSYLDSHRNYLSNDFILPDSETEGRITRLMNKIP